MADKPIKSLWEAAQQGDLDKVKFYVKENLSDRDQLALHYAAQKGHAQIVRVLLENGFDPNKTAKNNNTALHLASQNGHTDVVKVLLELKADPLAVSANGTAALIAKDSKTKEVIENWIKAQESAPSRSSGSTPKQTERKQSMETKVERAPVVEAPKVPKEHEKIISLAHEENWDAIAKLANTLTEVPPQVHAALPLHSALRVEQEFHNVHLQAAVNAKEKVDANQVKVHDLTDQLADGQARQGEEQREVERLEAELARAKETLTKTSREVTTTKGQLDQVQRRLTVDAREADRFSDIVAKEEKKISELQAQLEDFKGKLFSGDLTLLTAFDVSLLLTELKMGKYRDKFNKEKVSGKVLDRLSEGDLRTDLGIESLADRKRLMAQIQKIKSRTVELPISATGGVGAAKWSVNEVIEWLQKLEMGEYGKKFREEHITGDVLLTLTSDDLRSYLKMERLGDRILILEEIKKLQEQINDLSNQVHHDDI
eukprot:TRINITY_DN1904_c0_g1_i4.p2 TRINITY_DN1904_c0_g1~~TRINITY_DN1904_c0_g1_i4.p2  ORF type:complete len:486 (-),score=183.62 TRINITY_DN1904_c0_g1_i4:122-1579(-)